MLRILDTTTLTLMAPLQVADDALKVSSIDALKLNAAMVVGDTAYFVLRDARGIEQMKYTHVAPIVSPPGTVDIPVARAMLGSARRVWPVRSCATTETTEGVINALICQRIAGGC